MKFGKVNARERKATHEAFMKLQELHRAKDKALKEQLEVQRPKLNPVGRPRSVGDAVSRSAVITREQDDAIRAVAEGGKIAWSAALRVALGEWMQARTKI